MKAIVTGGALLLVGLAAAGDSVAAPPAAGARLSLDAAPAFGIDAPTGDGWLEVEVRLDNPEAAPRRGMLVVTTGDKSSLLGGDPRFEARAPFQVPPHASSIVHVPMAAGRLLGAVTVTARGDDASTLAETSLSLSAADAPLLVDVDQPSRLGPVLRGWPITPAWVASGGLSSMALAVGVPAVDSTTGDPVLPERAACYAPATVVLLASDRLAHLKDETLAALVGWVLAGGTLAVVPTRPEDLRLGVLTTLVGGAIAAAPPPPVMMTLAAATRGTLPSGLEPPASPTPLPPETPDPDDESEDDAGPTPIVWFRPLAASPTGTSPYRAIRTTRTAPVTIGPSAALRPRLSGFTGGNLRPTAYGATASYGLGQVHVLGFDPTKSPAIEDGWTHGRLLDMVTEAWDRRALVAFPQGAERDRTTTSSSVQRALDPNQNFRPALGVAAILLVLYAIASGPLVFLRARKKGRPLDPLVWAPAASAICFATVVVIGLAGKGWRGRARRLALVEAGAGMSRGTTHRFRGLFASQTRTMRVTGTEPQSVMEVVGGDADSRSAALRVDRDGATLEDLKSIPWQTLVVAEDGFSDMGRGITVRSQPDGGVAVTNHTGRRLKDVVVWAPRMEAAWFAGIDDGATVVSTVGRTAFHPAARVAITAGARTVHELNLASLNGFLDAGALAAWGALSEASGTAVDWWPDDVPVVIGEVVDGDGARTDAGLRVESDRLMFRVVGEGGAP